MKTVVVDHATGLKVEDVPTPDPGDDQVLVQVSNTGFCGSDHSLAENPHTPDGTILGHEVSGTVVETGKDVRDIEKGLRVMIRPTFCGSCRDCVMGKPYFCQNNRRSIGIGDLPGAFAEYFVAFPQMLIPIPDGVDSQNAALAEAFAASLHGIEVSGKQGPAEGKVKAAPGARLFRSESGPRTERIRAERHGHRRSKRAGHAAPMDHRRDRRTAGHGVSPVRLDHNLGRHEGLHEDRGR